MNLKVLFGALVLCSSVVLADDWDSVGWDDAGWDEPAPAAKPAPKPAPAPAPAPAPEAQPAPAPTPAPAPEAQPAPAPTPAPAPEAQPAPAPAPAPAPVAQPAPAPAPAPAPVAQPAPAPAPAPAPVAQPAPAPAPAAEQPATFVPSVAPVASEPAPQSPTPVANVAPAGAALDLDKLTAKDTDDFNIYSNRLQLIMDSVTAAHVFVQQIESDVKAQLPPLAPKGEFEKMADFEKRRAVYDKEVKSLSEARSRVAVKRIAELEEAADKIRKIQSGMYSDVEVRTFPENAQVVLSTTGESLEAPAKFESVVPGKLTVTVSYPSYETRVVEVELKANTKLKLDVVLEEQSIFSREGEIKLSELLLKNSTKSEEYKARVVIIENRIRQTDGERTQMINKFMATYPKLSPQQPNESSEEFARRRDQWQEEGNRQYSELISRCDKYRERLLRAIEVLNDYMVAVQAETIRAEAPKAQVTIGSYDSEAETFSVSVVDSLDVATPFLFSGVMKMPIDKAATFDRSAPFKTEVEYLNFPLKTQAGDRYIAMSNLYLSRGGVPFDVDGSFSVNEFANEPEFVNWKAKSDSILAGELKTRGLTAEYAYGSDMPSAQQQSGESWTWRAWTRIAAAVLIAGGVGVGIYENSKANDVANDYNTSVFSNYEEKQAAQKKAVDDIDHHQTLRNVFYGVAGAGLLAGVITFVF
ncbi:PEGA domain-containing protein [Fibrobacter sp. UWH9]|uniref:PEGA domain-containing protein n=1 Tax=Fibrobacter sp. UWH9 TaxID=1896213 RepID=UPI0009228B83|nr:PEGA domain-containing protein [Fibrobacter sp. UWH9]SHH02440.1 PEGA domain-containing protein [Fibrobacter sp. UWH9]